MYRTKIIENHDSAIAFGKLLGVNLPKRVLVRSHEKATFIPNEVMDNMRHLSATAFKIYVYLIRHDWFGSKNYQGCFLKLQTLADETGYSKSTVSRAISELRTFGWLETKPAGEKRMPNGMTADIDCFEYTFFYPVDDDGRAMVSPSKEQAVMYRKLKNLKDGRTMEEKGLGSTRKAPMRMELPE